MFSFFGGPDCGEGKGAGDEGLTDGEPAVDVHVEAGDEEGNYLF